MSVATSLDTVLTSYFWPKGLEANTRYTRIHDDCDGDANQFISVLIDSDGDAWVETTASLRFRMPLNGGGGSDYTRTALVCLAEAIRRDNIERNQVGETPENS